MSLGKGGGQCELSTILAGGATRLEHLAALLLQQLRRPVRATQASAREATSSTRGGDRAAGSGS